MKYLIILSLLGLTACATPAATMYKASTDETAVCGGEIGPSIALGAIGYQIAKQNDNDCIAQHEKAGYKIQDIKQ